MAAKRMVRFIIYSIELIVMYILQSTSFIPAIGGARPLLLVCAAMTIALFEGDITGMAAGIFAGLLIDMAGTDILGIHGLILGVLGYVLGTMTMELFRENLLVTMVSMVIIIPVVCVLEWLIFYVLPGYDGAGYVMQVHYLPKMLYTLVISPLFYWINRFFAMRLSEAA